MTLDPSALSFRPLRREDFSVLHAWLNEPHVMPWFDDGATMEEVEHEYGEYVDGKVRIFPFVVSYGDRAIGLIQHVRLGDFPEYQRGYEVEDPDTLNCDVLIGDPAYVHQGLGPHLITRFLAEIAFPRSGASTCIIDPWATNKSAIRAYEKAGFRHVRTIIDPEDGKTPLYLMETRRAG